MLKHLEVISLVLFIVVIALIPSLFITHSYIIRQVEASVTLPDDSFKSKHQCTEIVKTLDSLGLLGTKYWELKGNCNHDNDLEETYHDTIRTLRTLGEIEEVVIPN